MSPELKKALETELAQLKELVSLHTELISRLRQTEPSLIEKEALSAVLLSFYGGLETIWRSVEEDSGIKSEKSESWHMDLLSRMKHPLAGKAPLLSPELFIKLKVYLKFRHRMRQGYATKLDWSRMKELVMEMEAVLGEVDQNIELFIRAF